MSEQVPPPSSGAPSDPPADPSPSSGSTPGSGSGSSSKGWAMVAIGFCVVVLGVLVAGVVSRDDSGKSANTAPSVSVDVTQATTAVEGHTVTQTAPPATVTGEVTVTGSTPTTTRTTPTTPTTTRTTDSSGSQTSTTSP